MNLLFYPILFHTKQHHSASSQSGFIAASTLIILGVLVGSIAIITNRVLQQDPVNLPNHAAGVKCDGWADEGSVHCNTSQCQQYTCGSNGQWSGPQGTGVCSSHPSCNADTGNPQPQPTSPPQTNICGSGSAAGCEGVAFGGTNRDASYLCCYQSFPGTTDKRCGRNDCSARGLIQPASPSVVPTNTRPRYTCVNGACVVSPSGDSLSISECSQSCIRSTSTPRPTTTLPNLILTATAMLTPTSTPRPTTTLPNLILTATAMLTPTSTPRPTTTLPNLILTATAMLTPTSTPRINSPTCNKTREFECFEQQKICIPTFSGGRCATPTNTPRSFAHTSSASNPQVSIITTQTPPVPTWAGQPTSLPTGNAAIQTKNPLGSSCTERSQCESNWCDNGSCTQMDRCNTGGLLAHLWGSQDCGYCPYGFETRGDGGTYCIQAALAPTPTPITPLLSEGQTCTSESCICTIVRTVARRPQPTITTIARNTRCVASGATSSSGSGGFSELNPTQTPQPSSCSSQGMQSCRNGKISTCVNSQWVDSDTRCTRYACDSNCNCQLAPNGSCAANLSTCRQQCLNSMTIPIQPQPKECSTFERARCFFNKSLCSHCLLPNNTTPITTLHPINTPRPTATPGPDGCTWYNRLRCSNGTICKDNRCIVPTPTPTPTVMNESREANTPQSAEIISYTDRNYHRVTILPLNLNTQQIEVIENTQQGLDLQELCEQEHDCILSFNTDFYSNGNANGPSYINNNWDLGNNTQYQSSTFVIRESENGTITGEIVNYCEARTHSNCQPNGYTNSTQPYNLIHQQNIQFAFSGYPVIMDNGSFTPCAVQGGNCSTFSQELSQRNVVAVRENGQPVVINFYGNLLYDAQRIISDYNNDNPDNPIIGALHMDAGHSTQLYYREENGELNTDLQQLNSPSLQGVIVRSNNTFTIN